MKRHLAACIALILFSTSFLSADAQTFGRKQRKENEELKAKVEALSKELEAARRDLAAKDSLLAELAPEPPHVPILPSGLEPDEYDADVSDSLLSVWYLQRQLASSETYYDLDSVSFTSDVPDSVLMDRLHKMNSYITLPYNERVRNYIVLYSEKMPSKMSNMLGLSQYYFPVFEEVFSRHGLPDELKYMAVIESALNPVAKSRAGATGMWQFMTRSAKQYGLEINSFVDERMDPYKSAEAAADYLEDMYNLFGDWNLAISSYNCGPGNVNKAIRRNGGDRSFWKVYDYLPRETRGYVPAFVGAMYGFTYHKEYGIEPSPVAMPAQVDTFLISKNLHFQQISDLTGISVDELRNLNPQYIKDIIPGDSKQYVLRLPYHYSSEFIAQEDSIYNHRHAELFDPKTLVESKSRTSSASGSSTYRVKKGDSLYMIAKMYPGVSAEDIKRANNIGDMIHPGMVLKIPRK